jgi:hypothetical protein
MCTVVAVVIVGTLHMGDEIREVNNVSIFNKDIETVQKMLVCSLVVNRMIIF